MGNGVIGKFIYFWAFMIGVVIFGKFFGFMNDTRTAIMILVGAALIFVVWTLGRYKAQQKREEREYEESMKAPNKNKKKKR
ncbi:MAG: hypothetical protein IJI74_03270 [Firmicutes bacterium]|nr:hypothetical protein [Bacillota bacterium]